MEEKKWSTGAWRKQTAKGEVINFTINDVKYSMWVNSYKKEEKQPDFKIFVNDFKPTEQTQGEKPSYGNKDFDDFLNGVK
jgi:hypothetical protein